MTTGIDLFNNVRTRSGSGRPSAETMRAARGGFASASVSPENPGSAHCAAPARPIFPVRALPRTTMHPLIALSEPCSLF